MSRMVAIAGVLLGLLATYPALVSAGVPWIHIHINETGSEPENVRVNVPLSVLDAVLPEIEKHAKHESKFDVGDCEMTVGEYRQSIRTLSSSPRREVKFDKPDGTVVMRRDGPDLVLIQTPKPKAKDRTGTRVRLPWHVATALAKGDGESLDVAGAMRALAQAGQGEISVHDDDGSRVRIWIDEVAFPAEADA